MEALISGCTQSQVRSGELINNASLSVAQRLNIAIDVATAMDYLHHQCHIGIVHYDLKPSNVLLDSDLSAHVSDFGLSKFLTVKASGTESSSIGIRGTIGYVAPGKTNQLCLFVSTIEFARLQH